MDWLSDNAAFLTLVNKQTNVMYILPNRGMGWKGNELRDAIDAAKKEEKKKIK